jgi:26S proteasome regulatory subunit N10
MIQQKISQISSKINFLSSFDNSDYQRNGDYLPTRLNAQKEGINLVCLTKLRSNPENNVGLLTLSK